MSQNVPPPNCKVIFVSNKPPKTWDDVPLSSNRNAYLHILVQAFGRIYRAQDNEENKINKQLVCSDVLEKGHDMGKN
jgi:hypothetical protein